MPTEPTGPSQQKLRRFRRPALPPVGSVGHALSLGVVLLLIWLLLSGYLHALLLTLGAVSCLLVVYIALRMDVIDREAHPVHLSPRIIGYWFWLLKAIWQSALDVTRRILSRGPNISPVLVQLKTSQRSEVGQVIYANSITLTPGTFTIRVFADRILVHALSREGADALAEGEMDRRVTRIEGES